MDLTKLSKRVIREIEVRNFSVREFARLCGLDHVTILNIVEGETTPNLRTISKIAKATGRDVAFFIY
jgi:transcriptional regulator with XRE-family HTH domain